jgi:hypothetical protein
MSFRFAGFVGLLILATAFFGLACGGSSSSANQPIVYDDDDDNDTSPDDDDDASPADDDASPADDDASPADNWVAPWPQSNVEKRDYNENVAAGPLRTKAMGYDTWYTQWQSPYYGAAVETYFTDSNRTTPASYGDQGDSTIWTGTYLGAEAFEYWVTNDAQAKAHAIATVKTLDGHLHVTGKPGFIARFRAPIDSLEYPGDASCDADTSCRKVTSGPYAGDFWYGNTSRDQYTGWFFGMVTAYDLIDDEPTKQMIVADVTEVVEALIKQGWWIMDTDNLPTTAGPNIMAPMKAEWLLIAYHMTGADEFKAPLQAILTDKARIEYELAMIDFMNRYTQYYGNNLSHTTWYSLLRLGKVYFSAADYQWFLKCYDQHETYTRLSHNAWFDGIYMSQGPYTPSGPPDPYQTQLVDDLTDFVTAPSFEYALAAQTGYTVDPISELLNTLMTDIPFLGQIMGTVNVQALYAFPVPQQCTGGFFWQDNPYSLGPCGNNNPEHTYPGADYLVAYWLGEYSKFITKNM